MTNQQFLQYLKYGSVRGKFLVTSTHSDGSVIINKNMVYRFNERSPELINWDKAD